MRLGDILAVFFGHNLAAALGLRGSVHLSIRDLRLGYFAHGLVLEDLHQGPEPMRNRHILKYDLPKVGGLVIKTGANPVVRSAGWQNGKLVTWIECDSASQLDSGQVEMAVVGTGMELQTDMVFLQTVQTPEGFVWHVFCEAKCLGAMSGGYNAHR